MRTKRICSITLAGSLLLAGCENPQEKARYVKEPLETVDAASLASVNNAVREARTRLVTVRNRELRAELSKDIDDEYQRMLAQIQDAERREKERAAIQAEKERAARELEERRLAMEAQKEREAERQESRRAAEESRRSADEERRDAEKTQRERRRQAVINLEVGTRPSLLNDGTQVLILRNANPSSADFDLRCYTRGDAATKTFFVTIPPRGEKHIGFLQGWCGNFKPGERCEAYCDGELLWNHVIR
jgi:hypothetical protein